MQNKNGFTLVGLMVTMALLAILAALAAPSFESAIRNNRLATQANALATALQLARAEAVKRRDDVTVVSTGGSSDWSGGWRVAAGGATLREFEGTRGRLAVAGTVAAVTFDPKGAAGGTASFTLCASSSAQGRRLLVNAAGLIRTQSNFDGCP